MLYFTVNYRSINSYWIIANLFYLLDEEIMPDFKKNLKQSFLF